MRFDDDTGGAGVIHNITRTAIMIMATAAAAAGITPPIERLRKQETAVSGRRENSFHACSAVVPRRPNYG